MRALIAVCFFAVIAAGTDATAGIGDTPLNGVQIGGVHVLAGPHLPPGLTREQLEERVLSRLEQAGVPIVAGAPAALEIEAQTLLDEAHQACFTVVKGRLVEGARLERNGRGVSASSWSGGGSLGTWPPSDCAQGLTRAVEDAAGQFVEMYQAMNPKP
jgi:hypothetical protein